MSSSSKEVYDPHGLGPAPTLLADIRLIFATILTDPGSSLAYGADAVVAVTGILLVQNYELGLLVTFGAGAIVMGVYLLAILVYNSMTRHHVHRVLGGGAFVSSFITAQKIQTPWLKKTVELLGKTGTASLLSDFPVTQAISLIAGVEALYFIGGEDRLYWAFGFCIGLSFIQRFGLGNLARYMIWPVVAFYITNLGMQLYGLNEILQHGWHRPELALDAGVRSVYIWPLVLGAVANGATLITGVEVGYSSVNLPYHKGHAIRISMWVLYAIVVCTYSLQLVNFLGLGIDQTQYLLADGSYAIPPLPIQIAQHLGGDAMATPFGLLTALMLLLAAQTAQTDFPLEILRASRSNFFPRAIGDTSWKKTIRLPAIGGHDGVYNPRATLLLAALSMLIMYLFPHSHQIESMYGLAVITAMCIDIAAYFLRQARARRISILTVLGLLVMLGMFGNILYNKFFHGAWFILILMILYMLLFLFSEAVYELWNEKLNLLPLELALVFPAFQNLPVDHENLVLVSRLHPGVIHFLKNYARRGRMPLLLHFQTDPEEKLPEDLPEWFKVVIVPNGMDTITAITRYVTEHKPERVHLIPLLVRGIDPIKHYYFGNSIERLKHAISIHADLQVEYNKERVNVSVLEVFTRIFPILKQYFLRKSRSEKTD